MKSSIILKTVIEPENFFLKKGQSRPLFVYFRFFLITISKQIEKSLDGVLGIRTWGRNMVGANKNNELWRPPPGHTMLNTPVLVRKLFAIISGLFNNWNRIVAAFFTSALIAI